MALKCKGEVTTRGPTLHERRECGTPRVTIIHDELTPILCLCRIFYSPFSLARGCPSWDSYHPWYISAVMNQRDIYGLVRPLRDIHFSTAELHVTLKWLALSAHTHAHSYCSTGRSYHYYVRCPLFPCVCTVHSTRTATHRVPPQPPSWPAARVDVSAFWARPGSLLVEHIHICWCSFGQWLVPGGQRCRELTCSWQNWGQGGRRSRR